MPEPSNTLFTVEVNFDNDDQLALILETFKEFCQTQGFSKKKYGYFKTDQYSATLFLSLRDGPCSIDFNALRLKIDAITQSPL